MKVIIAGAGDVGFHISKLLAQEEHDIVLIDLNQDKLNQIANNLDLVTVRGDSSSYRVLSEANVTNADLVIAATSTEENNLLTAIIAKKLGAKQTIARIQNVEFLEYRNELNLKEIGVDEIISPESLAAKEIKRLLKSSAITDHFDFGRGKLSLIGITINEEVDVLGKRLEDYIKLNPKSKYITVAILRENKTIIPRGDTVLQLNDHVYYLALPDGVDEILSLTKKESARIKNIMILGGSKIGYHAAKKLSRKFRVKLIESNKSKCFDIADELQNTLVIHGDGREVKLLEEEGIEQMDAFIAVTGNSETNIISSLVAKNHGVKKTIALVENIDYIHLSQGIGVDTMINKKLIAANFIFRYIRQGQVLSIAGIHGVNAEILEFKVRPKSKITEKKLKRMIFPRNAIIGGVIRKGEALIPGGNFTFEPEDRVVVLSCPDCIHAVEDFFV